MVNSAKRARDRHAKKNTKIGKEIATGQKKQVSKRRKAGLKQAAKNA